MYLSTRFLLCTSLAVACLAATTGFASADEQRHMADIPQIMITGHAHEWRVPDEATTAVGFTGNGLTPDAAINDLLPSTEKATKLLKDAGIDDADTWSTGPDIEPLYKHYYDGQGREIMEKREPNGYRATFHLNFKSKDIQVVGKLIPQMTDAKATIEDVAFAVSDYRQLEESLEERAVADAVMRAKRQIEAAGAKAGRVLSIGEQPEAERPVFHRAMAPAPMAAKSPPRGTDFSFALRPGKQDISIERPVIVEILPN